MDPPRREGKGAGMTSLMAHWMRIKSYSTEAQMKDTERWFYLGALTVLSEVWLHEGCVSPDYLLLREGEIRRALNYPVEAERDG